MRVEAILVRHGLFRPDLRNFAVVAAEQLSLLGDAPRWREGDETGEVLVTVPDDLSGMGER